MATLGFMFVEPSTWGRRTGTNARALRAWWLKHEFVLELSLPGRGVVDNTSIVHEWGSNALITMPKAGSCCSWMLTKVTSNVDDDDEEDEDKDEDVVDALETLSEEPASSAVCTVESERGADGAS